MSERFQKSFISVREFVESWDKELYELTNLDFFIYLMINHLGNQLEKRFFIHDKRHYYLYLDYNNIGTVCFNLGDGFEYFLEENCLGSCPLNCPRDLDNQAEFPCGNLQETVKRRLMRLRSFISGDLDKENCLRIDLMNYVLIDTLIQFYNEELQMEVKEDDLSLLELAEFIIDVIIDFIRMESQSSLLLRPFEIALDYFEDLLQNEVDEKNSEGWAEEKTSWEFENKVDDWQTNRDTIDEIFQRFTSDQYYNPGDFNGGITHDISYFRKYLKEYANICDISELKEHHIAEFFSIWLAREFIMNDEKQIPFVFRAFARFITFLYHQYNVNLKRDFLRYYDLLKQDLPRVIQAANKFISEYNLFEAILTSERNDLDQKIGFFEIIDVNDKANRILFVKDLYYSENLQRIKFDSSAIGKLKKGDVLHLSLVRKSDFWEVTDIQYIYPNLAKRYIHSNH